MPRSSGRPVPSDRLEDHRPGAVAEEHAGGAVLEVEDAREGLGADHHHPAGEAGAEEGVGLGEGEDEAGADRLDVEGEAARHADRGLHLDRGRGKGLVGGRRRQDDRVDVGAAQAGVGEGGAGGGDGEVRGRLALGGEVAALDAGARPDPFVGGVEGPGELGVLDDALGQVVAAAERDGAEHAHVVSPCWASAGCSGGADAGGELAGEAVVGEGEGEADGGGHRGGVGRAVGLDDRAVEPEEDPAVRAPRVDAVLQALERGQREERADAAERAVGEGLLEQAADQARGALGGLQRDVAGEAVA